MDFEEILIVLIVFTALTASIVTISLAIYFAKRLKHKQIIAAIEKGTPLSELRPPKPAGTLWIRSLTFGIAMIIIGLAYVIVGPGPKGPMLFVAFILFAIGIALLIRGLLYRKYQPQTQTSDKTIQQ